MCKIKHPESWTSEAVDSVLLIGDGIYLKSIKTRGVLSEGEENPQYLTASEVFPFIRIDSIDFKLNLKVADVGHLWENVFGCLNLRDRLELFLETDRSAILTSNNISVALGKIDGKIWLFDSHARDSRGFASGSDKDVACVMILENVDKLYEVLDKNIGRFKEGVDRRNWFELHQVEVERLVPDIINECQPCTDTVIEDP